MLSLLPAQVISVITTDGGHQSPIELRPVPVSRASKRGQSLRVIEDGKDPIYDLDHEGLHLGIGNSEQTGPCDDTGWRDHRDVAVVADDGARPDACGKVLQPRVADAGLHQRKRKPLKEVRLGWACGVARLGIAFEGGRRAAVSYTLITTARLNGLDPQAWLADVIGRIADHPASRIDELLPWAWSAERLQHAAWIQLGVHLKNREGAS